MITAQTTFRIIYGKHMDILGYINELWNLRVLQQRHKVKPKYERSFRAEILAKISFEFYLLQFPFKDPSKTTATESNTRTMGKVMF